MHNNNRSDANGATNNDLSRSAKLFELEFITPGHFLSSLDGQQKHISFLCHLLCHSLVRGKPCGESKLHQIRFSQHYRVSDFWQIILDAIAQLLKHSFSLLLLVSNAHCIGLSPLLLISHLYTWVDRSSTNTPPPQPSAASCERDSCENSVESVQPGRGTLSLLYLPILTRFSRDIRGNKRSDIPTFKAPPDNFDARFTLNKRKRGRGAFWTASLGLKWGDT